MRERKENNRKEGNERKREEERRLGQRTFPTGRKTAVRSLLSPFPYARTENGRLI